MKNLKIIDLTHLIDSSMTIYPGTKRPEVIEINHFDVDGFRVREICLNSHSGTHIDTPAHMLKQGKNLSDLSILKYIGRGMVLDFSKSNKLLIDREDLLKYEADLREIDFLLIYSGFDKLWSKESYLKNFPVLSNQAVDWLVQFDFKGFGVDMISVDSTEGTDYYIHKTLLKKDIIIIENLRNLEKLLNKSFTFHCFPLNIPEADGSPVRAVAILN